MTSGLGCFPSVRSLSICGFFVGKEVQTLWKIYPIRFISLNLNVWRGNSSSSSSNIKTEPVKGLQLCKRRVFLGFVRTISKESLTWQHPLCESQQYHPRHWWGGPIMADGPGPASNEKEDWKWEPRVCESSSASPEHSRLGKQAKVLT